MDGLNDDGTPDAFPQPDEPRARRSARADRRAPHRLGIAALVYRWASSGDNARLFPVWVGGLTTGLVAAAISAPIAAGVFGGVTGGGTDALVALFRTLGLNVFQSAFAQGLTSDPLDKTISYTIVFIILGALPSPSGRCTAAARRRSPIDRRRRLTDGDVDRTGYFVAGSSWLHRRHPLTKLLGVGLRPARGLPPAADRPAGDGGRPPRHRVVGRLLRPILRAMRIPALLLTSIIVVNALFFPGATDRLLTVGPLSVTREGLTFGLVSAGRVLVAFLASVTFLFTTLADDLLEAMVSRGVGHRSPSSSCRRSRRCPACRRAQHRSSRRSRRAACRWTGSFGQRFRALVPLIGPVILGSLVDVRERTFALEARGFGARPGRTAYRVVPDPPVDRVLRLLMLLACVGVVVVAVTGVWR